MISSRKRQLEIALILACLCAPALYAALDEGKTGPKFETAEKEPNEPRPEVKIEISDKLERWVLFPAENPGVGPIKPTHVAEFFIWDPRSSTPVTAKEFLNSSVARSMTRKQLDFLEVSDAVVPMDTGDTVRNHNHFRLYAVSEEDARKMIEAFIEIRSEKANRRRLEYVTELRKYQEEMAKAKGLLPGKEALLPTVKAEYDKSKEYAHAFSADTEAPEQAKQTMLEMNKVLDTLDVELAGIREKLEVIRTYWSQRRGRTNEADAKLEEIQIIQTIELKGAEARRKAAVAIRKREKDFLDLFDKWTSLDSEVKGLRSTIDNRQKHIAEYEAILANPKPDMLPPKIYQDKVVIYPVNTD